MPLNVELAMDTHLHLGRHLQALLDGRPTATGAPYASPHRCELGRWLKRNPGATALQRAHQELHRCSGEVVRTFRTRGSSAARLLLNGRRFAEATGALARELEAIRPETKATPLRPALLDARRPLRLLIGGGADPEGAALECWLAGHPSAPRGRELKRARLAFDRLAAQVRYEPNETEAWAQLGSTAIIEAAARVAVAQRQARAVALAPVRALALPLR